MEELSPELMRAARLSALPGVTLATACDRFGVTKPALEHARKMLGETWLRPSREDLVVAILTDYATATEGPMPASFDAIASYIDFVEKDGCTAVEVRSLIDGLVQQGLVEIAKARWKLLEPWPFQPSQRR